MKTAPQNSSPDFIESIISSYEERIHKIEEIFHSSDTISDSSTSLFKDFEHSISELRKERLTLNETLRENLAQKGSLRKNDYDIMMNDVFLLIDRKEKDAEKSFSEYVEDQKGMIRFIRQGLLSVKNTNQSDYKHQIEVFKHELEHVLEMQQQRKDTVISNFLDVQNIHSKITEFFKMELKKEDTPHYKDVKEKKKHLMEIIQ